MEDHVNPYVSPGEATDSAPPGAVWTERGPVIPYATARTRARWTMVFLSVILIGSLASAGASWMHLGVLQKTLDGDFHQSEIDASNLREGLIALVLLVANIGTIVSFLMWFHRAHRNLPALGAAEPRFSPGWAVGWWFIPFMNLFRPYQVAKEIWKGSDPATMPGAPDSPWSRSSLALVRWWWFFFLLMNFAGQFGAQFGIRASSIEELLFLSQVDIVVSLVTVLAALVTIFLVRRVTLNQDDRFWRLTEGASKPAA